jgi:hypothetical protein
VTLTERRARWLLWLEFAVAVFVDDERRIYCLHMVRRDDRWLIDGIDVAL